MSGKRCQLFHFSTDWEPSDRFGRGCFFLVHNCYVCQPANFGLRKPKSVTESCDILIGTSRQLQTERGQCIEPTLMPFDGHCSTSSVSDRFYWFTHITLLSVVFLIWKAGLMVINFCHLLGLVVNVPGKSLWIELRAWGRGLTWQGWNFCGMQGWLLFRLKIGDFYSGSPRKLVTLPPPESVEQEVIRWCDNH